MAEDLKIPKEALEHLNPIVKDVGVLLGLLTPDGSSVAMGWFDDPFTGVKKIPDNRDGLLQLLRDLLGDAGEDTPTDRAWYPLERKGEPTGAYVVLPTDDKGTTSTIGLGLWHDFSAEDATVKITGYVYVPLFLLPLQTPVIVTGSKGHAIEVVLDVKDTKEDFSGGGVTFNTLELVGSIYFGTDPLPGVVLNLKKDDDVKKNAASITDVLNLKTAVNAVIGSPKVTEWLDKTIPATGTSYGTVLKDLKLLDKPNSQYELGGLSEFTGKTPAQVAEELLAELLKALSSKEEPLITLGEGGIWVVGEDAGGGATDYGLRLAVPDIHVVNSHVQSGANGRGGNKPDLVLQLGKWLTGEEDKDAWVTRADKDRFPAEPEDDAAAPGASIFLVRETGTTPAFKPRVELVSLGLDFVGGNDKPLVDVKGFRLGGFEPRFFLSLDFDDLSKIPWGGAVRVDQLGLPLGNGLSGSAGNPVAQNLLSSGSSGDTGAGSDNEPVNPEFSAAVSKIVDPDHPHTEVDFQLYSPEDEPTDKVMLPIQRALGPLYCRQLGVEWDHPNPDLRLGVLFDGGVALGPLAVDLEGLEVGIPLKTPGDLSEYELGLEGLAISFHAGPVEIIGGLFKDDSVTPIEYNGEALIKAGPFSIAAIGSWATLNDHPSLFIFAWLEEPLGGPAFFFVTGVSAGFGYNRSIKLPAMDKVQDFPLVAGLSDPKKLGGEGGGPGKALEALSEWVKPAQGVNWVAAGVQFTSFELINSNALVIVEFGKELEIAILGLSRLKLPQEGTQTYAYVELGLEVILRPEAGVFSATAVISPDSFVIDKACHLHGGFAFFLWFGDNEHAGDFVLTIGGYHPLFKKPAWYPDVPRLGFDWPVGGGVSIKGDAYFALTPSCVMGGGALSAQYHSGNLKAWFTAHADFLIQWNPFHFIAGIGVSIGVSYRLHLLFVTTTIKIEIGADIEMWGPPTGGTVTVHLWVVSFTVGFGAGKDEGKSYIDQATFQKMLPQNKPKPSNVGAAAKEQAEVPLSNVCKIVLNHGLIKPAPKGETSWLIRPDQFEFSIETKFPVTELDLVTELDGAGKKPKTHVTEPPPPLKSKDTTAPDCARKSDGYYVGVRPMGIICTDSVLTVTVQYETKARDLTDKTRWSWEYSLHRVPEALWGQPVPAGDKPKAEAKTLPGRLMGIGKISPIQPKVSGPPEIPLENLSHAPINLKDDEHLPFPGTAETGGPAASETSLETIHDSVADDPAKKNRTAIFDALAGLGYDAGIDGDLSDLKAKVDVNYAAQPMLGSAVAA